MNYIGRTSSLHFLIGNELHRNGEVHGGSMNHIGTTLSLHFPIRSKLHCNGQVHGGSMNHIDPTSSLHFLIRSKLHRNGEVHRGSMHHYFFHLCFYFFIIICFFTIFFLIEICFFPQQPLGLGFSSLNPSLGYLKGSSFGQVQRGSVNHIATTSLLHFLIRSKLHCNGEVHGGSMNYYFFQLCLFLYYFSLVFCY